MGRVTLIISLRVSLRVSLSHCAVPTRKPKPLCSAPVRGRGRLRGGGVGRVTLIISLSVSLSLAALTLALPLCTGKCCGRVRSAMTTSSREVLPG